MNCQTWDKWWERGSKLQDKVIPWSRWINIIDMAYFAFWVVFFAILSYVSEVGCTEAKLLQFGVTAFWMNFAIFLFSGFTTLVIWNFQGFVNGNPYEKWAYLGFIVIELTLVIIIIIWGWAAAGASTKVDGCVGLYEGALIFSIITLFYMLGQGVLTCFLVPLFHRRVLYDNYDESEEIGTAEVEVEKKE